MEMQIMARLIIALRSAGWDEKKINDLMLYLESGDDQYRPKADEKK